MWKLAEPKRGKYLYLKGGLCIPDAGCVDWGSADPSQFVFIGDKIGEIILEFQSKTHHIPLVVGYNVWFSAYWKETPEPFSPKYPHNRKLLYDALYLKDGIDFTGEYLLCIALPEDSLLSIDFQITHPYAKVSFTDHYCADDQPDSFFTDHTITLGDPYPHAVAQKLEEICRLTCCYQDNLEELVPVSYPSENGCEINFTSSLDAAILSNVYHDNLAQLCEKVDEDGFFHTSSKDAPTYMYNGFGFYKENAQNYYSLVYSRDSGRGIMSLCSCNALDRAKAAITSLHRFMMYYPDHYPELSFDGKPILGHYSVTPNMPFFYQDFCVPGGWPTQYTKEKFGEHYRDLGNLETDGHGLMMMAVYQYFRRLGKDKAFVKENWTYLTHAADWIVWSLDNPQLSFAKDDLLFAESEAGMNEHTLYANVPCLLGLMMYAEMASCIDEEEKANQYLQYAARMQAAIERNFVESNAWKADKFGFFHDPVTTFFADWVGFDVRAKMPETWYTYSQNAYPADSKPKNGHHFAPKGMGYDHCMVTQNALLLDQVSDYSGYVSALARLSYAPGQPNPYIVPEGAVADVANGRIRRQGDLGNLVQQAETIKVICIVCGIDVSDENQLLLLPRLPQQWAMDVKNFSYQGQQLDVSAHYPQDSRQTFTIRFSEQPVPLKLRFGPFPSGTETVTITDGQKTVSSPAFESGDSAWCYFETVPAEKQITVTASVMQ